MSDVKKNECKEIMAFQSISRSIVKQFPKHASLRGQSMRMCALVCMLVPQGHQASCTSPHLCRLSRVLAIFIQARLCVNHSFQWSSELAGRSFSTRRASLFYLFIYLFWTDSFHQCREKDAGVVHPRLVTIARLLRNDSYYGTLMFK